VDLYYPGWIQKDVAPIAIDFSKLTIVDNFAVIPNPDGKLNFQGNDVEDAPAMQLIALAHQSHRKVLITLGGSTSGDQFAAAVPSHETELITNLMAYVNRLGYDGIDLDIEPIEHRDSNWTLIPADSAQRIAAYKQFVIDLRKAMNMSKDHLLLTAAAIPDYAPAIFGPIQDQFDQINIMTYDMAGMWTGQTWFDTNLLSDPTQSSMPSSDKKVEGYLSAGVTKNKLGIGMMLEGLLWIGASKPADPLTGVTTKYVPINDILSKYFSNKNYFWDDTVKSSYLSIPASDSPDGKQEFLAYDDLHSADAKTKYIKSSGLGGLIIWEMGEGYKKGLTDQPIDDILTSIQKADR
jgi:chitinase